MHRPTNRQRPPDNDSDDHEALFEFNGHVYDREQHSDYSTQFSTDLSLAVRRP